MQAEPGKKFRCPIAGCEYGASRHRYVTDHMRGENRTCLVIVITLMFDLWRYDVLRVRCCTSYLLRSPEPNITSLDVLYELAC